MSQFLRIQTLRCKLEITGNRDLPSDYFYYYYYYFETKSHRVAQAHFELSILLLQPLEYWDYRYAPLLISDSLPPSLAPLLPSFLPSFFPFFFAVLEIGNWTQGFTALSYIPNPLTHFKHILEHPRTVLF
jgi:hypothetical protein